MQDINAQKHVHQPRTVWDKHEWSLLNSTVAALTSLAIIGSVTAHSHTQQLKLFIQKTKLPGPRFLH